MTSQHSLYTRNRFLHRLQEIWSFQHANTYAWCECAHSICRQEIPHQRRWSALSLPLPTWGTEKEFGPGFGCLRISIASVNWTIQREFWPGLLEKLPKARKYQGRSYEILPYSSLVNSLQRQGLYCEIARGHQQGWWFLTRDPHTSEVANMNLPSLHLIS